MAIEYLKKKKMHSIMCDIFGIAPKMIDTYYNFYRGSEWLQCSYGGCCYEIYASNGGAYLTSESKEYDWDADRYVNVNRKVYNGYGKYTYPIHEKCLAEEQETLKAEDLPFPEVMEQENKPWEMMDAEERADEFFNFPEEPEELDEDVVIAMAESERMQSKIINDFRLNTIFHDTFGCAPEQAQFMTFIDCSGCVQLIYQNERTTAYFIKITGCNEDMLEIVAQIPQ